MNLSAVPILHDGAQPVVHVRVRLLPWSFAQRLLGLEYGA